MGSHMSTYLVKLEISSVNVVCVHSTVKARPTSLPQSCLMASCNILSQKASRAAQPACFSATPPCLLPRPLNFCLLPHHASSLALSTSACCPTMPLPNPAPHSYMVASGLSWHSADPCPARPIVNFAKTMMEAAAKVLDSVTQQPPRMRGYVHKGLVALLGCLRRK